MPMGRRQAFVRLGVALLVAVAGSPDAPAMADEPAERTLRYSVEYQGRNLGKIEISISRDGEDGEGCLVRSVSQPNPLAAMFLESHTIESRYRMRSGEAVLLSGRELLTKTGEVRRSFEVDHVARRILFSAGEPAGFDTATRLVADPFPLGLLAAGSAEGGRFLSVNPKRARLFETTGVVEEDITVPAGTFATLRLDNAAPGNPERILRLWLRQGEDPVPVRIVSGRKGKRTVMELLP